MLYLAATAIVFWFILLPILKVVLSFCDAMGAFDNTSISKPKADLATKQDT